MRAKVVVLRHTAPMGVDHSRPLVARADAILPMILVGKTAARPAQDGDFDPLQGLDDIVANAAGIGDRTPAPTQIPS